MNIYANFDLADKDHDWAAGIERCVTRYDPLCWRGRRIWIHTRYGTAFRLPPPGDLEPLADAVAPLRAAGCALAFYSGPGLSLFPRRASLELLRGIGFGTLAVDASALRGAGTFEYDTVWEAALLGLEPCVEARMLRFGSPYPRARGWSVHCQYHHVARTPAAKAMFLTPTGIVRLGGRHYSLCLREDRGVPYGPGECEADVRACVAGGVETPIVPLWLVSESFRAAMAGG